MLITTNHMKLEEIINGKRRETLTERALNPFYKYSVDVLSGWLYYTPTYALQELAAGKDFDTVIKTRLIGMVAHAVIMRPVGLLRDYVAKKWQVTQESSLADKMKVNLAVITPVQAVIYAGMLAGGMIWSGNYDLKSSVYAWVLGTALGAFHAVPYGFVQDRVRKVYGVKPAIAIK